MVFNMAQDIARDMAEDMADIIHLLINLLIHLLIHHPPSSFRRPQGVGVGGTGIMVTVTVMVYSVVSENVKSKVGWGCMNKCMHIFL